MPLKCLACEHENSDADRFCGACGSSLDLQLCSSCEAINGAAAKHCHQCGAALAPRAAAPSVSVPVTRSATIYERTPPRRGMSRWARAGLLLALLALTAAGAAATAQFYYGYDVERWARLAIQRVASAAVAAIHRPVTASADAKPSIAVEGKLSREQSRATPSVAVEDKRDSTTPAAASLIPAAIVQRETAAAVQREAPRAVAPPAVVKPQPTAVRSARPRVTHTKAQPWTPAEEPPPPQPGLAAATAALPAAEAPRQPRDDDAPANARADTECPGAIDALGLCVPKIEGN